MKKQLSDEEISANIDRVFRLVDMFEDERKNAVKKMLEGNIGEIYFSAPASHRNDYHCCYVGGLCEHSLNVCDELKKICNALRPGAFSDATIMFVGLFHDLGKVGDGCEEYYIKNESDWHRNKGMLYEINKDCKYMLHEEMSIYLLQLNNVKLTIDEYMAIRLHNGQYEEANKSYRMKEPDLALLTHWADRWSTSCEKNDASH